MNLVLTHCWKEWRSQRGLLGGYGLLVFLSLCIGFLLVPEHWWREDGRRALALSWFVAAGVIGVVAFVAPGLVRGEFGSKDDQFVRRLPGALGVSFGGKLLFLMLATAALPLLGLACGGVFLTAIVQPPNDLFTWWQDGTVTFEWPWPAVFCGHGLLLVPWVWALGTWLPSGRMALGGTALLVLLLGLCVTAVLRQSPQIEQGLHWQPWLWWVAPTGLVVACVSWVNGRRGGGPLRSARFGLAAVAVGVLPPGIWLGGEVLRYHHPEPRRLGSLRAMGITEDQGFVLATGAERTNWPGAVFRIDLRSGAAEQVGAIHQWFSPELLRPHAPAGARTVRQWLTYDWCDAGEPTNHRVLDLATGLWTAIESCSAVDRGFPFVELRLPTVLREGVVADHRRAAVLRGPDGRAAWFEGRALRIERADGTVASVPWSAERDRPVFWRPAGHGFVWTNRDSVTFDLTSCAPGPTVDDCRECYFVRGSLFVGWKSVVGKWTLHDRDGVVHDPEGLQNCDVLGLLDDDRLLCAGNVAQGRPRLFAFTVASGAVQAIGIADATPVRGGFSAVAPLDQPGSLLSRDPAGRIWLRAAVDGPANRGNLHQTFVLLDTNTLTTAATLPHTRYLTDRYEILAWPNAHSVLMQQGSQILRIDTETGERTVLFPRR